MNKTSEIRDFIAAGKAVGTLVNNDTGNRFTYRFRLSDNRKVLFVDLLSGPENEDDYRYIGYCLEYVDRYTGYSRVHEDIHWMFLDRNKRVPTDDSPISEQALRFLFNQIACYSKLPAEIEFLPSIHCGRCGHRLTTPESIRTGLGPVCAEKVRGAA